jgi:hypothetical protein
MGISLADEPVNIVTEIFPPFQTVNNGKLGGISTELVRKILVEADIDYKITPLPWSRSLNIALNKPNTLMSVDADQLLFETSNPRHAHEWTVFRD